MLLTWLFGAATPNNPSFDLNSAEAWDAFDAGPKSATGMRVNPKTALTLPAFWRGVNLLSNYPAKLPLYIYKRKGDGKERATTHQSYRLVRWKMQPDPRQPLSAFTWKQTITSHALTEGNGYTYIVRDGGGAPTEGLILDPSATFPVRENGNLWYVTRIDFGKDRSEMRKLRPEDVHHIHGLGYDGVQGYPVVEFMAEALGLGKAQQKYEAIWYKNSGRASVVLTVAATLDKKTKDELREQWERMHSGLDNAHRTAVLDRGLQAKEMTGSARDNQLSEREKIRLIDFANILGLPVHKLGGEGRTAYASLEQENQSLLDDTLDAWLVHWEEETREKFLTEKEKDEDTHLVEFLRSALVRANMTDRYNAYRTALGGRPFMVPDEVRGMENLNPLGGEAAEYLNPLNMGQGGADNEEKPAGPSEPPKPPAKEPPPNEEDGGAEGVRLIIQTDTSSAGSSAASARHQAHRQLLADAVHGLCMRVSAQAERAAKEPDTFAEWVDAIAAEHGETCRKKLGPVGVLLGKPDLAGQMLAGIEAAYEDLAERATAKTLADEVARLNADLEGRVLAELGGGNG